MLKAKERRKKRIMQVLPRVKSIKALSKATRLKPRTLMGYFEEMGMPWPPQGLEPYKMRPEIDCHIENGIDSREIGELNGISRQRAHEYLKENGLYDYWKEKRKEVGNRVRITRKNLVRRLVNALVQREEELFSKSSWPEQKALEYHFQRKAIHVNSYSVEQLTLFFSRYYDAIASGERPSIRQLTQGLNLSYPAAAYILKKVGLKPFRGPGENLGIYKKRKI